MALAPFEKRRNEVQIHTERVFLDLSLLCLFGVEHGAQPISVYLEPI